MQCQFLVGNAAKQCRVISDTKNYVLVLSSSIMFKISLCKEHRSILHGIYTTVPCEVLENET